jgi:transposase-like protein
LVGSEHKENSEPGSRATDNTVNHSTGERPASRVRPIPEAYRNIQVNFCKTPGCPNLCVEPVLGSIRSGRLGGSDGYRVVGPRVESDLRCSYCAVESRIKSNRAIHQEFQRQAAPLFAPSPLVCPNAGCPSDPRHPTKAFHRFGKSAAGALRFRCRSCKATFSVPGPTARQRRTRVNAPVFRHLVNKVPLNRIVELCGVSFPTLYDKIRFIHRQCSLFAASRETRLPEMDLGCRYLSTDRQDYIVNWGSRTNRKTVQLTAVATADRESGYLFAFSPNFDASLDQDAAEAAWLAAGDADKPPQMRDTARFWTKSDYAQSLTRSAAKRLPVLDGRKGDEVAVVACPPSRPRWPAPPPSRGRRKRILLAEAPAVGGPQPHRGAGAPDHKIASATSGVLVPRHHADDNNRAASLAGGETHLRAPARRPLAPADPCPGSAP